MLKCGKSWNVRFDKVLARFYLIKIFPCANGFWRVPNVARAAIPVVLHLLYWRCLKNIAELHSQECFPTSTERTFGRPLYINASDIVVAGEMAACSDELPLDLETMRLISILGDTLT